MISMESTLRRQFESSYWRALELVRLHTMSLSLADTREEREFHRRRALATMAKAKSFRAELERFTKPKNKRFHRPRRTYSPYFPNAASATASALAAFNKNRMLPC